VCKISKVRRAAAESPPKAEKRGLHDTAYRIQRIERKIMPYRDFFYLVVPRFEPKCLLIPKKMPWQSNFD